MSDVRLTGVSKRYEGATTPALPSIDLEIPHGELAVLVGPSGCGKSTTLRLVAGLEDATTGKIFIGDRDVTNISPAERDVAMVFQSYALYPHMTVFENMAFALTLRRVTASEIKKRVDAVATSLGLTSYLQRTPKALSGGQRQRVAIGRAMVREPKVFLFDEPLSNLDAKLRGEMRRVIAKVHRDADATSLYVTHDQVEAMTLADRIVVMRDGVIQQIGAPEVIYGTPSNKFVAGFFGTPSMNFLVAEIDAGSVARGAGFTSPFAGASGGSGVVLGIRPESLRVSDAKTDNVPAAIGATVTAREMLGSEALLHLSTEAGAIVARVGAEHPSRIGDNVGVRWEIAASHWFDAATEERR